MDAIVLQFALPVLTTAFLTGVYVQGQREIIRRLSEHKEEIDKKVSFEVFTLTTKNLKERLEDLEG